MRASFYCLSLEPRLGHALQKDRDLSDVRQGEERLPNVPTRPGIWCASALTTGPGGSSHAHDCRAGLPVQVRDQILQIKDAIPTETINKEYFTQNAEGKLGATDTFTDYSKAPSAAHEVLKRLARSAPYYKRNRAHLCSFFAKGQCTRGDECPFRHELPDEDPALASQNIKDRFHGVNDPVALKMLQHLSNPTAKPLPPSDPTIKTLFINGLNDSVTEADLRYISPLPFPRASQPSHALARLVSRTQFFSYGEIASITLLKQKKCAFVTFATREAAEDAIERTASGFSINGTPARVQWGRPAQQGPRTERIPESGAAPLPPGATHSPLPAGAACTLPPPACRCF